MVPMSIVTDKAKAYADGYIFGMIRNGRGLMPTYNRIEEPDRWAPAYAEAGAESVTFHVEAARAPVRYDCGLRDSARWTPVTS